VLFAAMVVADIAVPSIDAHENAYWTLREDAFDLIAAVPLLGAVPLIVIAGMRSRSYRWRVALGGGYSYIVYQLVIYTSAVRFGPLFLVYYVTLGLAAFGLLTIVRKLRRHRQPIDRYTARLAGSFLVGTGVLFAVLWLALDLPTLLNATPPRDLGLFMNPVHVIDLSFVVPTRIVVGMWLWQRRSAGELYAPILLAFGVIMAASIGGMMIAIELMGGVAALRVAIAMFALAACEALVLARVLRRQAR
jgi:hypothetical protein